MTRLAGLDRECLALVEGEIAKRGSIRAVALAIGYARPSLSLAMRGAYSGSLDAMSAAIRERLGAIVACPHLSAEIPAADCRFHRERPIPTADPAALKHWRACRFCPLNPNREASYA